MALLDGTPSSPVGQRSLEHRVWWSPNTDRWTFFGFFLVGGLFILTLKALVDSQVVVTSVPCALMLAYASLMWDFGEQRPRSDAAGDNLYYLGFLYTLTSLAHSLYRFSADEADTEVIVTNFGIAIFTTILGMALRVLMGRPTEDPSSLDESARLDLAETARKLRREMSYTVETFREALEQDLDSVRQRLAQHAAETQEINSKTVKRMQSLGRTIARLDDAVDKAAGGLVTRAQELDRSTLTAFEDSIHRLDSRAREAVEAIEQRSTALTAGAEEIRESLLAQAKQVRAVDFRKALLNAIELASTDVEAAVERTASRVDTRIDSVVLSIEERSQKLGAMSDAVQESLREQAARIGAVDFRQAFLDHAVEPASNELRSAAVEFRALLDTLRKTDAARDRALASSERASAALHETLNGQHGLAKSVLGALQDSRDAANSLRAVSEQLVRSIDGAQDVAHQISSVGDGLAESAERIRVVNEDLTHASATLRPGILETERVPVGHSWFRWLRWPRA